MKPIDVVLIDLPRVLSDIVEAILQRDPGVRVAAQLHSGERLDAVLRDRPADVAIVGGDGGLLAGPVYDLLCARPSLRVLTVGGDGRDASLFELRPHRTPLGEISPDTLLDAVRAVDEDGCAARAPLAAPPGGAR